MTVLVIGLTLLVGLAILVVLGAIALHMTLVVLNYILLYLGFLRAKREGRRPYPWDRWEGPDEELSRNVILGRGMGR